LIIAFLSILGSLPGLYLPETADRKMPETLEDMKEFGRHDRFSWMPICKSRSRFKKKFQYLEGLPSPLKDFNTIHMKDNKGFDRKHDL